MGTGNPPGTNPEALVKDATMRLLQEDDRFRAAVLEGKAYADRGEFIKEEEMDARFEQMLSPKMRIRWTPPAAEDMQSISDYLKQHPRSIDCRPCGSCMSKSAP